MDPLFQKAKEMYPNASNEEISAGLEKIRTQAPQASDEEILQNAQKIQGAVNDGSFNKIAVTEQVKQKYNLGDYSPEKRQALINENAEAASPWMAGLAGFGAGLRGGDVGAGFKGAMDASQAKTRGKLEAFDTAKKSLKEDFELDRALRSDEQDQQKIKRENDLNSPESKMAQNLAIAMGMNPEQASSLTAAKFKDFSPALQKKYEIAEKAMDREERTKDRQLQREMVQGNRDEDRQERAKDRQLQREMVQSNKNVTRQEKIEKEQRLGDKQVEAMSGYDKALNSIQSIRAGKSEFDTGPLAGRANALAGMVGIDDPKKSAFRAEVQDQLAQYVKSISGGAVSDSERASLMQNLPNMNDNDATFNAKLDALEKRLQGYKQTELSNLKKQGKNVKEWESPVTSKPAQKPTGKIRVSNGKEILEIDASDEADAAKDGYKRI